MKCMKMRQAVCLSGCWNAAAKGVLAEASICLSQEFIWLGRVVEVDVTVVDFVRATLCEGVVESSLVEKKSHRAAISLQPVGGEGVNAGIFSTPMRFRTKFTATGASDDVFDPCEPSYNHKTLKYEQSNRYAIQWQIQEFSA